MTDESKLARFLALVASSPDVASVLARRHPMSDQYLRLQRRGCAMMGQLGLALFLSVAPDALQAGIVRDVLASVGLAKPTPPPVSATGDPVFPRQGFACCNLHNDGSSINDGNYAKYPLIPAGTPIEVLKYGRNEAAIKINGKQMRLVHDYGRDQETLDQWVHKIVVDEDPTARIAGYPPQIQAAIHQGRISVGMTREQAVVAIGYPLTSENTSLDEPVWKMWRSSHGEYDLHFEPNGRLGSVTGEDEVTSLVVYQP
jgi:hypothetical protein